MSIERTTWLGFLRSQRSSAARTLLSIGGSNASACANLIRSAHRSGRIDDDTAEHQLSILKMLRRDFADRKQIVDGRDPKDWKGTNGGFQRVNHIYEDTTGLVTEGLK